MNLPLPGPGRKPKYKGQEHDDLVYKIALVGARDEELARCLDICPATFYAWLKKYPSLLEARNEGKDIADANVAESLYRRATGYTTIETRVATQDGKPYETEVTKEHPPDTTACIFWLKNRQPALWRERQQVDLNAEVRTEQIEATTEKVREFIEMKAAAGIPEPSEKVLNNVTVREA